MPESVGVTLPDTLSGTAPAEWDGWGDEADKIQFEKRHPAILPLGEAAVQGITHADVEDDGWGIDPTSEK